MGMLDSCAVTSTVLFFFCFSFCCKSVSDECGNWSYALSEDKFQTNLSSPFFMHTLTSTCYREESFDFQFFIGFISIYFAFTFYFAASEL